METKFKSLYESLLGRYQQGGFVIGDRVKYRKDCLKLEFFANKPQSFIDIIKTCMESTFDLNLRVSSLKSTRPTTSQNYRGGTESPDNIYADVIIEYAPGLYRNPVTVPIEAIEILDDGINTGPVPDSVKRKNDVQINPSEVNAKDEAEFDINLNNKNVKLSFAKPPGEWKPLPKN
jgi:hypothetical protein